MRKTENLRPLSQDSRTKAVKLTANYAARHRTVCPAAAAKNLVDVMPGPTPEDSGQFFDYAHKPIDW